VVGDNVYTQEQRAEMEVVVCYDLKTGDEIWTHQDPTRFEEAIAGPGPRATPTFADGKLYSFGGRGRLNCLNPSTGDVIWTHDVLAESGAQLQMWGFSASPLVSGGLVTVITGAKGKSVMAYAADTGQPVWAAGDGWSYASTQLSKIDGVPQLLCITADGLNAFEPQSGKLLWHHDFPMAGGASRITQPVVLNDNDVLIGTGFGIGARRIRVSHDANGWKTESLWTSRNLKPYYNDMVLHKDFLYGFDGSVFVCIDPTTGTVRWRAHGYGNGQVLLIADQDLLLIIGEQGEAALVCAKQESHQELCRFQALNGKTWNHPVIAHGRLLVRNGEEAACYDVK
jgi:outer membrane protein assembly factor BamB